MTCTVKKMKEIDWGYADVEEITTVGNAKRITYIWLKRIEEIKQSIEQDEINETYKFPYNRFIYALLRRINSLERFIIERVRMTQIDYSTAISLMRAIERVRGIINDISVVDYVTEGEVPYLRARKYIYMLSDGLQDIHRLIRV